ncbi:hypothetical protein QTP88_003071 [Uroleucon formosanum]
MTDPEPQYIKKNPKDGKKKQSFAIKSVNPVNARLVVFPLMRMTSGEEVGCRLDEGNIRGLIRRRGNTTKEKALSSTRSRVGALIKGERNGIKQTWTGVVLTGLNVLIIISYTRAVTVTDDNNNNIIIPRRIRPWSSTSSYYASAAAAAAATTRIRRFPRRGSMCRNTDAYVFSDRPEANGVEAAIERNSRKSEIDKTRGACCVTGTNSPPNVHACTRPFGPIQIKLNYLTDFTPPLPFLFAIECYSILRPLRTVAMLKIYCLSAEHFEVPKVSYSGGIIDGVDDD